MADSKNSTESTQYLRKRVGHGATSDKRLASSRKASSYFRYMTFHGDRRSHKFRKSILLLS